MANINKDYEGCKELLANAIPIQVAAENSYIAYEELCERILKARRFLLQDDRDADDDMQLSLELLLSLNKGKMIIVDGIKGLSSTSFVNAIKYGDEVNWYDIENPTITDQEKAEGWRLNNE